MSSPAENVRYVEGGTELLPLVAPLWESLNRHIESVSEHFAETFAARTFAGREAELVEKSRHGRLRVDLARTEAGDFVAYCVATIDDERTGEIDSIFVQPDLRGRGIGDALMRRAMQWMDVIGTRARILDVTWGNEPVWSFYQRYGFRPRSVKFVRKPETEA